MWATSLLRLCVFFHDGAISVFFQGQSDATCLHIFQFFLEKKTLVSNGVDTMRFPCTAPNVKVVRNSKQARVNGKSNHDSHNGSHVCSECQSGSKQARVNGKSNHDPL